MSVAVNNRTKGLSFKTRENQLKAIDSYGNKETMSSKVTDIEKLIPQLLGVNKAILEYVVFCHQEDSLWPIGDSASLKKKFDEIFDSVKFIDALQDMKEISKKLNIEIKELTLIVSHLLEDKKRYIKKLNSISEIELQTSQIEDQIIKIECAIQETNTQLNDLHNSNQDFEQIISKVQTLTQQRESIEQNIERIESTTEILLSPQQELRSQLNDFVNVVANQRIETESLKSNIKSMNDGLEKLRLELNNLLIEGGKFKADKEKYQLDKQQKSDLITLNSKKIDATSILEFDAKLNTKVTLLTASLSEKTNQYDRKITTISTKIQEIKNEITKESQHEIYLNQDIKTQEGKKIELQNRLISISNNQTMLKTLREELIEKEQKFDNLNPQNEINEINDQLNNKQNSIIPKYELDLEKCQENMKISRGNSEISSKINVLKDLNKSSNRYLSNLIETVEKTFPGFNFDDDSVYQNKISGLESEHQNLKIKLDECNLRLADTKYSCSNVEIKLKDSRVLAKNLTASAASLKSEYRNAFGANMDFNNFNVELATIQEQFDDQLKMVKFKEFLIDYYKTAVKYAKDEGACKLCNTQLHEDDQDEEDEQFYLDFIKRLQGLQMKYEKQTGDETDWNLKKSVLDKLRDSKHDINQLMELERDIPILERQLLEQRENVDNKDSELSLSKLKVDEVSNELTKWKLHSEDIKSISRIKSEITGRDLEIKKLNSQLAQKGLTLSNEELELEYKRLTDLIKSTRVEIDSLRLKKDQKQNERNEALNELNELKLKINDLELKSLDKLNIEKAISETEEMLVKLRAVLKSAGLKLIGLNDNLDKSTVSHDLLIQKKKTELSLITTELQEFESIKDIFRKVNESIDEYETNQGDLKYEKSQSDIHELKTQIISKEESINDSNTKLNSLELNLANSNNQERTIRFNIDLIDFKSQLHDIDDEISTIDIDQAQMKKSEYLLKSRDLQQVQMKYQKDIAGKLGEKTQLEKQITSINSEIDRDYNDIDKRHANRFMELQTKLALATDLSTCYKATDDSILKYHRSQMDKINNIIDELWKKTYMGNDIETIQIKSDPIAVKTKVNTTTRNNRSYNYRVVMFKNGNELDMRGRCSAGQKVLASIIIRIALAECFGTNFGMISLDEPTTNLDEENIESLARALHKIIKDRMEQKNFQLIVITHDEKFLRMLNAVDFTDYYYKIQRNERLNSVISKVKINSITN